MSQILNWVFSDTLNIDQKRDRIAYLSAWIHFIPAVGFSVFFNIYHGFTLFALIIYPLLCIQAAPIWGHHLKLTTQLSKRLFIIASYIAVVCVHTYLGSESNVNSVIITVFLDSILFFGLKNKKEFLVLILISFAFFLIPFYTEQLNIPFGQKLNSEEGLLFRAAIQTTVYVLVVIKFLILAQFLKSETQRFERQSNIALDALDENKKMLKMLCHDIKNPLTVSMKITQLLPKHTQDVQTHQTFVNTADAAQRSMLETINNMVFLSEEANLKTAESKTSFTEICHQLNDLFFSRMLEKRIQWNIVGDPSQQIICDIELLTNQILANLVSNAIKFSPPNSKIDFILTTRNSNATISIKNEGTITQEALNGEFVSTQGTFGEKGSGIGLTIVRKFCQICNIAFEIKNEPPFVVAELVLKK